MTNIVPPASKGVWNDPAYLNLNGTSTDAETIENTIVIVDQKTGASGDPDQPIPATAVTAVDGTLTAAGSLGSSNTTTNTTSRRNVVRRSDMSLRSASDYDLVFGGTGLTAAARDASIQGTAYLTFTLVNNATYNVADCLKFCDSVEQCGELPI